MIVVNLTHTIWYTCLVEVNRQFPLSDVSISAIKMVWIDIVCIRDVHQNDKLDNHKVHLVLTHLTNSLIYINLLEIEKKALSPTVLFLLHNFSQIDVVNQNDLNDFRINGHCWNGLFFFPFYLFVEKMITKQLKFSVFASRLSLFVQCARAFH